MASVLQWVVPPVVGAVVGYFTNDLAVRMLFHPLEAKYIGKFKVPLTPGLVPAEQERLADKISHLIVDTFLTPEDFQGLVEQLLTAERVQSATDISVEIILTELKQKDKMHTLADDFADALSDLVQRSVPALTEHLAEKSLTPERIQYVLDQVIDSVIQNFQLTPAMSQFVSEHIMELVITPEHTRQSIISLLTPANIAAIDEMAKERLSGKYSVLLFFVNLQDVLTKMRLFLDNEPAQSNALIEEILELMRLEDAIQRAILRFNPRDMSWDQIATFKGSLVAWLHDYLSTHYDVIVPPLVAKMDIPALMQAMIRRFDPENIPPRAVAKIKSETANFLQGYLEKNLHRLVKEALKMANLQTLIGNKIRAFSPARMEEIILDVSRKELSMIVWFGAVLGFLIGCLQAVILVFVN